MYAGPFRASLKIVSETRWKWGLIGWLLSSKLGKIRQGNILHCAFYFVLLCQQTEMCQEMCQAILLKCPLQQKTQDDGVHAVWHCWPKILCTSVPDALRKLATEVHRALKQKVFRSRPEEKATRRGALTALLASMGMTGERNCLI